MYIEYEDEEFDEEIGALFLNLLERCQEWNDKYEEFNYDLEDYLWDQFKKFKIAILRKVLIVLFWCLRLLCKSPFVKSCHYYLYVLFVKIGIGEEEEEEEEEQWEEDLYFQEEEEKEEEQWEGDSYFQEEEEQWEDEQLEQWRLEESEYFYSYFDFISFMFNLLSNIGLIIKEEERDELEYHDNYFNDCEDYEEQEENYYNLEDDDEYIEISDDLMWIDRYIDSFEIILENILYFINDSIIKTPYGVAYDILKTILIYSAELILWTYNKFIRNIFYPTC